MYIRDFDVGGIDMQRTGRLCERRGCKGYLRDCLLDWDSELPEDQFLAAEVRCRVTFNMLHQSNQMHSFVILLSSQI